MISFEHFSKALLELTGNGFQLPMYLSVISLNGCILSGKYFANIDEGNLDCEIFSEHLPSDINEISNKHDGN
jgi:hypothetical protein